MGQMATVLGFGDFLPQDVWAHDDGVGVVEMFGKAGDPRRDRPRVPQIDHDQDLVFFLVAISAGYIDGIAELNTGPVSSLERDPSYRRPLARARRNWEKFRKHAAKRGVDVGDGKLWLTQVEVG